MSPQRLACQKHNRHYPFLPSIFMILFAIGLLGSCSTGSPVLQEAARQFVNITVGPEYEALLDHGVMAVKTADGWDVRTGVTGPAIEIRKANVAAFRDAVRAHGKNP